MDEKNIGSVCFAGHRNINLSSDTHMLLVSQLKTLINDGCSDFYSGGSVGWDTVCERAVLDLKANGLDIRLHLILPCPFEEQTRGWSEEEKQEFLEIQSQADSIEYVSTHYSDDCMKKRNQKLIDSSDMVICYFDGRRTRSGTGQTVRMAETKGLPIKNFLFYKAKATSKSAPQFPN